MHLEIMRGIDVIEFRTMLLVGQRTLPTQPVHTSTNYELQYGPGIIRYYAIAVQKRIKAMGTHPVMSSPLGMPIGAISAYQLGEL